MSTIMLKFWHAHDQKILIILSVALAAVVGFQLGKNQIGAAPDAAIEVKLMSKAETHLPDNSQQKPLLSAESGTVTKIAKENNGMAEKPVATKCAAVASKSSTKFHLPTCKYASKIKKENLICFSSEEEAKQKGFQPAKCCHK